MTASLTVTYDSANSRVKLVAAGLNASTASSVIYRWENGEAQTVPRANLVRGGNIGALTGATIYDYTFAEGVANAYEIITYNSVGAVLDTVSGNVSVTPSNSGSLWLKSVYRPYLNRVVHASEYGSSTFAARGGTFDILGQIDPVAVTDYRGARQLPLTLVTSTAAEAVAVETFFQFGDIVFLQPPNASVVLPGFFVVSDVIESRKGEKKSVYRYFDFTLVQIAEPDSGIVGYTSTWAGIVSAFATWTALEAAFATWALVPAYISSPSDEING